MEPHSSMSAIKPDDFHGKIYSRLLHLVGVKQMVPLEAMSQASFLLVFSYDFDF